MPIVASQVSCISGKQVYCSGPLCCFTVLCARGRECDWRSVLVWGVHAHASAVIARAIKRLTFQFEKFQRVRVWLTCHNYGTFRAVHVTHTPSRALHNQIYKRSIEARRAQWLLVCGTGSYIRFLAARESLRMLMARREVRWSEKNICLYHILHSGYVSSFDNDTNGIT